MVQKRREPRVLVDLRHPAHTIQLTWHAQLGSESEA